MTFHEALPVDYLAPGESMIVDVDGGFPVAIANVDGEYFAFQSLCPHEGTTIGGRPLQDECYIVCPQHASKYDVRTGTCVRPAETDGFAQDLMMFATRIEGDVVQVQL
jgi:3-phenylpropionate/trans-cinnamate dioxygenase ferredoxin subunit